MKRTDKGQFAKGHSGNKQGKPKGVRNKITLAAIELFHNNSEILIKKAIEKALEGDMVALKLCIDRLAPVIKEQPMTSIELPTLTNSTSVLKALATVTDKLCNGELLMSEAKAIYSLLAIYQKQLDISELQKRVDTLEQRAPMDFNSFYDDIKNNHSDDLR
ncbi:hypothetical protein IMCC1989_1352 [gamma proteobacterium IMCC1989]|nr:hypothetical protein IMCC1989_1352 [gamma proteobacterium IMCC1989]